ncbi:MAG: peptidylprolyl isomerase [Treponema sp.]|jgi:hypothetical protein|nr:peptidylprolyl isomerase [Treponema sp.]
MTSKGNKKPAVDAGSVKSELISRFKSNPFVFTGTIIVLVIVIIAFVLVPAIVPEAGSGGDLTFGYYDKSPISYVAGGYFAQVQDTIASQQQTSINEQNYPGRYYAIWQQAFQLAVIHTGILQEMKNAGYTAPAKAVDWAVARLPMFQEDGRFSPARYQAYDNNRRLALWYQVQEEITKNHYLDDMTGLLVPSRETAFISGMASPVRSFDMAVFSINTYPDSELLSYIEENAVIFQSTHLSKITVNSSEKNARKVLGSIQEGTATFEEAANTQSQDGYAERGGDMGIKLAYELNVEVLTEEDRGKLLALKKGELSDIIKLDSGWAFFRAEEDVSPADTEDPAVRDKIRSYMQTFNRSRMDDWALARAEEFIALVRERGFDGAIIEQSLEKRHFGPLPVNYGGLDLFPGLASFSVSELASAPWDEDFWKLAFSTPLRAPSAPFVQGTNVLVLFPLEESEADTSSVQAIDSTLSAYWINYHAERALNSFFLNSGKLENNFDKTYERYFQPQS